METPGVLQRADHVLEYLQPVLPPHRREDLRCTRPAVTHRRPTPVTCSGGYGSSAHGTAPSRDTQHQQHAAVVVVGTSSLRNSSSTRRQLVGGAPLSHSLARSAASKRFDESFRCCRSASRSRCCGRCVRGHAGQPRGMSCSWRGRFLEHLQLPQVLGHHLLPVVARLHRRPARVALCTIFRDTNQGGD
eukprot:COSAG01_NODE_7909_length_2997_cov_8.718427_2_plen_189_part_00